MDNKKQKLLIEYLISSPDTFAICQGILDAVYFDPEFRNSVRFLKKYFSIYNTTPTVDQVEAETGVKLKLHNITKDQLDYTTSEIETFCRHRAIERAILDSPDLITSGDYGTLEKNIRDAVMVSLHRSLGLRYFDDPADRLKRMLNANPVLSTGWSAVDELLYGGISRKELLLVSANSGGGKSITLANLGFNFIKNGYNVLYVSLELSEDVVAQRFDTMYTGISRRDWKSHVSEIVTKLQNTKDKVGILDIVQMPTGTQANTIKAFLKEYHLKYNFMPDMLILDYLDKMYPNESINLSDVWTKDKLVSEQLRQIGVEFNMVIATASQLNREAVKATHHDHSHIAGGISKINESDVYWSIMLTDTMKAAGEIAFTMQKTRNSNGDGKTVHLKWDEKKLRIVDRDGESKPNKSDIVIDDISKFLSEKPNSNQSGDRLLKIMSDL